MSNNISRNGPPPGGTSVTEYGQLLRRFWWVVAVCGVLGVLGGIAVARLGPPTYTSTTTVLVGDTGIASADVANSRTSGELNLDTEAQLVQSGTVGERAAEIMDYDGSVYSLRGKVAVRVPPNSGVLLIDYHAGNAERAAEGSTAFAQAYLDNRRASAEEALHRRSRRLTDSLDELRVQLQAASIRAEQTGSVLARTEVDQLTQQIRTASAALSANRLEQVDPGSIISAASPATSDGGMSQLVYAVGTGFLGLILGLGVALLGDRLRLGRLRLSDLRALRPGSTYVVRRPGTSTTAEIGPAEARRMWAWLGRLSHSRMDTVTVAAVGDGAAVAGAARAALALAEARAEDGREVAFSNSAAEAAETLDGRGVHASLPAPARWATLRTASGSSLRLTVPAAKGAPKSQSLPGDVSGVLLWLATSAEDVVYHVSPLPDSTEAVDLAPDVDMVLVVAVLGQTSRRDLDLSLELLSDVGATDVAVVVLPSLRRSWRSLLVRGRAAPSTATDGSRDDLAAASLRSLGSDGHEDRDARQREKGPSDGRAVGGSGRW